MSLLLRKNGFKPGLNHLWSGQWRSARGVVLVKDAEQMKRCRSAVLGFSGLQSIAVVHISQVVDWVFLLWVTLDFNGGASAGLCARRMRCGTDKRSVGA